MNKNEFLFSFLLMATLGASAPLAAQPSQSEKRKVTSQASEIAPPDDSQVYATGMIYARPTRGKANYGFWMGSDEMHLVVGNFQDDTKYSGNTWDVSTKSRQVFNQVEALDQKTHYIFDYWYSYPFHWQKQSTSTMVTGVREAKRSIDFPDANLPWEMSVVGGKTGSYTKQSVTNGRIVEVMRWRTYILGRAICSFVLDQGGSRRSSEKAVANEITFNVYSEEGCKYVESIIPYGLELKVTFDQAYATIDGYDHFAHKITVDGIPGLSSEQSNVLVNSKLSAQQKALYENPEFQNDLQDLVIKYWNKMYGPAPLK